MYQPIKFQLKDGKIEFTATAEKGTAMDFRLLVWLDENGQPEHIEALRAW